MRKFYEVRTDIPDGRCRICRHHKYLIVDYTGKERSEINCIHTHIDKDGGYMSVTSWIHWWCEKDFTWPREWRETYQNFSGWDIPSCLKYYKEIKE